MKERIYFQVSRKTEEVTLRESILLRLVLPMQRRIKSPGKGARITSNVKYGITMAPRYGCKNKPTTGLGPIRQGDLRGIWVCVISVFLGE